MDLDLATSQITRDPEVPWKARICYASARDPALMPVVLAFTGVIASIPPGIPQWASPATIHKDGNLYGQLRLADGTTSPGQIMIGPLKAVVGLLRKLADNCKLNDDERIVMFDEFKKWCRDLRAESGGLDIPGKLKV
jgi:hypothetical protein